MFHLNQRSRFDEDIALLYVCEIILALECLHSKNIIYRDLKPENILIDIDGHIKLSDFGLAKEVEELHDLNRTFCGSPEYLSPEMLLGNPHDVTVDFYTLGVFMYEMISGLPPFYQKDKSKMNHSIKYARV